MGGGNCLFGTESVYRGKYSIVEVASDSVRTELPDMGTWKSGTLDTNLRCFDLLCTGKCDLTSTGLKLRVESVDKIPNFFTKNSEGKIVFSTPSPMSVITTPKGHGTWIQIELKTINGVTPDSLSGIAKHICLGIKKRSENSYFDVIHSRKLTSEYVDLFDTDAVELVPLLSKTELTSDSYELIKPSDEIIPSDFGLTGTSFDFGSVYRVNIKDHGAWIERECNLSMLDNDEGTWDNDGSLGIGRLADQDGDQMVAIKTNGCLARSIDGTSWFNAGKLEGTNWSVGPTYGNGTWCIVSNSNDKSIMYSIDKGKTWQKINEKVGSFVLGFGGDVFIIIKNNNDNKAKQYDEVFTSTDAKTWTQVGVVERTNPSKSILIFGNNRWICGGIPGHIHQSNDRKEWKLIGKMDGAFWGGCYGNGYFYVVCGSVMRSSTGEKWEEVTKLPEISCNITYYKNKLYSINQLGTKCYIGIPNS